eukprot:473891_1
MTLKYLISSFSKHIIRSKLMTFKEDIDFVKLLRTKIFDIKRFNLLFRASEHGFKAKDFHNKCDNHAPTITIIQSNFGNIFGGYTKIEWTTPTQCKHFKDRDSFLFLIRSIDDQNKCPLMLKVKFNNGPLLRWDFDVFHYPDRGPTFGEGRDLCIRNNCNTTEGNICYYTNYVSPQSYDHSKLKGSLCGGNLEDTIYQQDTYCFQVLDYEVFQIQYI